MSRELTYASQLKFTTNAGDIVFNPFSDIDCNSNVIKNVTNPSNANDAATKEYVDTSYTATSQDTTGTLLTVQGEEFVYVNNSSAITITLPAISSFTDDKKKYHIIDISGTASTYNITISRGGSDTINGDTSTIITKDNQGISLVSISSTQWIVY